MLSMFESALLDRHLRRCASCRAFALDTEAQTQLLRGADLEEPGRRVAREARRPGGRRRVAGAGLAVVAAAAATAAFAFLPGSTSHSSPIASRGVGQPVLMVVPVEPVPEGQVEVPRLQFQPASIADGPVRGAYSRLAPA